MKIPVEIDVVVENCPFDDSKTLSLGGSVVNKNWRVICSTCNAAGPTADTANAAVDLWNAAKQLKDIAVNGAIIKERSRSLLEEPVARDPNPATPVGAADGTS